MTPAKPWTGPQKGDVDPAVPDVLLSPVPGDRWPYGPPDMHQPGCNLLYGGLFCDCAASSADDPAWGSGGGYGMKRCTV